MKHLDHLVYASPDLQTGIDQIETLLGIRAVFSGRHLAFGTHNALLALGPKCYLEIVSPDPTQTEFQGPLLFSLDTITVPRLVTWVARTDQVENLAARPLDRGLGLGEVGSGSRQTPEGATLTWKATNPYTVIADGVVPFLIDWEQSPHPAGSAPSGAQLIDLRAEHPEAAHVQTILDQLDLELTVSEGVQPALVATIDCPLGRVELR
jgi:hypothetical protein